MEAPLTFRDWFERSRARSGLTQQAIATLTGLDRTYVNKIAKGRVGFPEKATRAKFHSVFGTSDEDLIAAGVFHIDPRTEEEIPGPAPTLIWPPSATAYGEALTPIVTIVSVSDSGVLSAENHLTVSISYDVKHLIDKILEIDWDEGRIHHLEFTLDGWLELDRQRRTR